MMRFAELIGLIVIAGLIASGFFYWFVFRPLRQAARDVTAKPTTRSKK